MKKKSKRTNNSRRNKIFRITTKSFDDLSPKEKIEIRSEYNRCEICEEFLLAEEKHLDHNHTTGSVRGILCMRCNVGLGMFNDSPWILRKAERYLKKNTFAGKD